METRNRSVQRWSQRRMYICVIYEGGLSVGQNKRPECNLSSMSCGMTHLNHVGTHTHRWATSLLYWAQSSGHH